MEEYADYLGRLIGHVLLKTGPVLIEKDQWEAGLPEDIQGVMVEDTQEGYLVFLTDKDFTNDTEDIDGNGEGVSPDVQTDDESDPDVESASN